MSTESYSKKAIFLKKYNKILNNKALRNILQFLNYNIIYLHDGKLYWRSLMYELRMTPKFQSRKSHDYCWFHTNFRSKDKHESWTMIVKVFVIVLIHGKLLYCHLPLDIQLNTQEVSPCAWRRKWLLNFCTGDHYLMLNEKESIN